MLFTDQRSGFKGNNFECSWKMNLLFILSIQFFSQFTQNNGARFGNEDILILITDGGDTNSAAVVSVS